MSIVFGRSIQLPSSLFLTRGLLIVQYKSTVDAKSYVQLQATWMTYMECVLYTNHTSCSLLGRLYLSFSIATGRLSLWPDARGETPVQRRTSSRVVHCVHRNFRTARSLLRQISAWVRATVTYNSPNESSHWRVLHSSGSTYITRQAEAGKISLG